MPNDKNERVSSRVMELKDLIAGPLLATIDADSLSAQRYLNYLLKIAFESYDPMTGRTGAPRMLTFHYKSHDLTGSRLQTVSIPVLTLVPLPLLQIHEADFDFDIRVLDVSSRQRTEVFSFETGQAEPTDDGTDDNDLRLRVTLAAAGSGKAEQSANARDSLTANMKVHVRMRQADMPGGLSMLLNKAVNHMVTDKSYDEQTDNH